MFDIPEIIEVLKSSGATDEVVEKVSSHFHNRLGDILEDMARHFGESIEEEPEESSKQFTNERLTHITHITHNSIGAKQEENNNGNITREQGI